ncbi:MAG: UDP-N-acetylglucosamine 2-epimerase, partial [bacterium]
MKIKIMCVVGARPNFVKVAPLMQEFQKHPHIAVKLVHTGQHYDKRMSDLFFTELGIPQPDISLGIGSGSHGAMTGKTMMAFE